MHLLTADRESQLCIFYTLHDRAESAPRLRRPRRRQSYHPDTNRNIAAQKNKINDLSTDLDLTALSAQNRLYRVFKKHVAIKKIGVNEQDGNVTF